MYGTMYTTFSIIAPWHFSVTVWIRQYGNPNSSLRSQCRVRIYIYIYKFTHTHIIMYLSAGILRALYEFNKAHYCRAKRNKTLQRFFDVAAADRDQRNRCGENNFVWNSSLPALNQIFSNDLDLSAWRRFFLNKSRRCNNANGYEKRFPKMITAIDRVINKNPKEFRTRCLKFSSHQSTMVPNDMQLYFKLYISTRRFVTLSSKQLFHTR